MRYNLSDKKITNYRGNGFLVIENFLNPNELEEWRFTVDEGVRSRGETVLPSEDSTTHSSFSHVFKQRMQLWMNSNQISVI